MGTDEQRKSKVIFIIISRSLSLFVPHNAKKFSDASKAELSP